MICGYQNIYDLCSNAFSYVYASITIQNNYAVADTESSVYRTDKISGTTVLLEPQSSLAINTCSLDESNEDFTAWDCYLWYKNNGGFIDNPPLEDYKIAQIEHINNIYNNLLDNGILIKIDNFVTNISSSDGTYAGVVVSETADYTILLPAKDDDIINFSNILSLATLSNNANSPDPLPPLIDYYNNAHFLNYYNLTNILSNYFNKLKYYANLKQALIQKVLDATSVSDVQAQIFYTNISLLDSNKVTDLSQKNNATTKFSTLTCEEVNQLCDPPCDPNFCLSCVDGNCESLCGENQYCCDGTCQDGPCDECETDGDCGCYCRATFDWNTDETKCPVPDGWSVITGAVTQLVKIVEVSCFEFSPCDTLSAEASDLANSLNSNPELDPNEVCIGSGGTVRFSRYCCDEECSDDPC